MKYIRFFLMILILFFYTDSNASTPPTIYNYRIYCITEGKNVYEWNTVQPTTCPNNTAHVINLNSISIIDERAPSIMTIQQETVPTGGWFKTETILINAATGPGVVTTITQSWPFNISFLNLYFQTSAAHTGDNFTIDWANDEVVGTLADNITIGATTATVSISVIQNIAIGFSVSFNDGTNVNNGGRIIAIDSVNNIITFETATTNNFSAATPTKVQITVSPINLTFGPPLVYNVAQHVIGGSHIPANQVATAYYTNNSNTAKQLYANIEYFY